ncbi:FAD/NAD-P-binding domain-containing protein [Mycena haematopus]|nr:FAD/NAD-P-binding domain-containing protein [Mycena haematopus]
MLARLGARLPNRPARHLHVSGPARSTASTPYDPDSETREEELVDVCIVGGGPAGLSAAIRLKQLEAETSLPVRVVVLEKGAEIGSHILSGAVIEPSALDALLPHWRTRDHPLAQPVTSSRMRLLTERYALPLPHPPQMNNRGNYVASLSRVAAWLGTVAEDLGAEIYPGFAGARLLLAPSPDARDAQGRAVRSVRGVITHDAGLTRQRTKSPRFEPGIAFRARATLLAEGAHGSLSKQAIAMYDLRHGKEAQTYGIGLKEVWRVRPERYTPGKVIHTLGWPLPRDTYGGGWEYHMADGLVSIGLVVGLDYKNPYLEPYREFQRMKHHPTFRALLADGERLAYGARTLTEGGLQSLPRLHFPGGALIGCAAGVVNTAKIKGTHNAMRVQKPAVTDNSPAAAPAADTNTISLAAYTSAFPSSPAHADLYAVRNVRPAFGTRWGMWGGVAYAGVDTLLGGRVWWTLRHHKKTDPASANPSTTSPDALATLPASSAAPIAYPAFEPPLSTDLMSSVALTGTNHGEGEAVHLRPPDTTETPARRRAHVRANVESYAGLLQRACPAGVYEYSNGNKAEEEEKEGEAEEQEEEGWNGTKLVINAQNCIHCKLCDVKVPTQDVTWTVPEGGGGPKYSESRSVWAVGVLCGC